MGHNVLITPKISADVGFGACTGFVTDGARGGGVNSLRMGGSPFSSITLVMAPSLGVKGV